MLSPYNHQDLGEYRDRARTMSPSILKKLRRCSLQDPPISPRLRTPQLHRNHSLQDNSKSHQENLLIGILKNKKKRNVCCDSALSSEHSSSEVINEEIEKVSRESLFVERDPLPRGSVAFEAVMTELGSKEDLLRSHTVGSEDFKETVNRTKGQSRKVHWDIE
ncbi:hypothetical protein CAPTEDRAFT_209913 [Capitella teleta]|uniref:Uncharacterized protein n=1 Tax=Capitella teleta TaxID=283909 RepID=R7TNQ1_CAPTE|nr:hypothetical protein CAPTEDRAFT_209913 [Capitella teleta]|eukprot:ELT95498.1 hypothetical protein CAPTEDRAFT_209913 [Capitella teleta]